MSKYANMHVYCQWRTFCFFSMAPLVVSLQLCVDNLNGVHCSGDSKCFMHDDKIKGDTIYVGQV